MKFIICTHNKTGERAFDIWTMPDTALHINKRPFFIPDYAVPCLMHLHRAVRICRLGRCISTRFADRYYDSVTLCARMEAPTLPPAVGCCFDECLSVGEWTEFWHADKVFGNVADFDAREQIAEVSQYFTLRQGDVILLDEVRPAEEVHIGQRVEEIHGDEKILQFNIK